LERLKVISRSGVGIDNIDLDAATRAGILVMNTPTGNTISTAEHTFAMMLRPPRSAPGLPEQGFSKGSDSTRDLSNAPLHNQRQTPNPRPLRALAKSRLYWQYISICCKANVNYCDFLTKPIRNRRMTAPIVPPAISLRMGELSKLSFPNIAPKRIAPRTPTTMLPGIPNPRPFIICPARNPAIAPISNATNKPEMFILHFH
ncbi:MAG: hypothetical protein KDA96_24085, partial [Planctomycetaceae bacterium]|nr:hypothetical protein [Planctomycetaceae bacterium]